MSKAAKIIIGIIIAAIIVGGIWYVVTEKPAEKGTVKIGAILPLSGELAAMGEEIKKGVEMAADEYAKQGFNLKVIYEDDQSLSSTAAVNAARKLLDIDKIDVGLTMVVEEAKPIIPLFTDKKIPLLVLWDSNNFIKEAGEYIFSNGFSNEKTGEMMAEYAFNNLNLKKVAIIGIIDPAMEIFAGSFKTEFEKLEGKVIYNEEIMPDTKDFRTYIAKIKQLNPDGVYFLFMPLDNAIFLMQMKQLGLKAVPLNSESMTSDAINKAGVAAEGVYFTNIYTDEAQLLTEKYKARYNSDPMDSTLVSFGYDGIAKIANAIQVSQKSLKDSLAEIFGSNRSANRVEKIYKIINGKTVEAE